MVSENRISRGMAMRRRPQAANARIAAAVTMRLNDSSRSPTVNANRDKNRLPIRITAISRRVIVSADPIRANRPAEDDPERAPGNAPGNAIVMGGPDAGG